MIEGGMPRRRRWVRTLRRQDPVLFLFILPVFVYFLVFHYFPLYGIQLAFKDYWASKGIWGSPWVGLAHFERFFSSYASRDILWNTVSLSVYSLLAGFPAPILLALMLHNCSARFLKKGVQNLSYMPYFISVVVMVGMLLIFLSPRGGIVNVLLGFFGATPVNFMGQSSMFRTIYVISGIWQGMGWGSIIYLATLTGIPPELYEAAHIDGAGRMQRIWHIDLPHLLPTAMMLLVLNCGSILNVGFEKTYLMQNAMNLDVSEIISTYVYKVGLVSADYGFSTAVGLFNNVVNLMLMLLVNGVVNRATGDGLF